MQVTNEGYILTRNVMKVNVKQNKILKFIKKHKVSLIIAVAFSSLLIIEGILLNSFINLLASL